MASPTAARGAPREPALDVEVLAHGEVRVGGRVLDQVADAREDARRARPHAAAQHLDLAAARPDEAEQHADRGRLAGAVPAEEAVDLAAAHVEVERVDGEHVAVALARARGWRSRACRRSRRSGLLRSRARAARARSPWRAPPASPRAACRRAPRSAARRARTRRRPRSAHVEDALGDALLDDRLDERDEPRRDVLGEAVVDQPVLRAGA